MRKAWPSGAAFGSLLGEGQGSERLGFRVKGLGLGLGFRVRTPLSGLDCIYIFESRVY